MQIADSRDALDEGASRSTSSWSNRDCLTWSDNTPADDLGLAEDDWSLTGGARLDPREEGGAETGRRRNVLDEAAVLLEDGGRGGTLEGRGRGPVGLQFP